MKLIRGWPWGAPRAVTEAEPEELSFGDRDDRTTTHISDMQLIQPEDPRSEYKALWLAMIAEKLDEGWRTAYSDGCGRSNHNSYACHREDRRGGAEETTGGQSNSHQPGQRSSPQIPNRTGNQGSPAIAGSPEPRHWH